jgi:hypothetical protein
MSGKRSSDADNNSADKKRPKMDKEDDFSYGYLITARNCCAAMTDFEHSKRITILQSFGTTVCHVPTDELRKIMTLGTARRKLDFEGASIEVYNLCFDESLVKFLAHWIHHRDSGEAIKAALNHQTETGEAVLNEKWLTYMINAINLFEGAKIFTCDIAHSLVDEFLAFLERGGLLHIDRVYEICQNTSSTPLLTSVFANVFIHRKKQFAQQDPTCDYDRAVQKHMQQ